MEMHQANKTKSLAVGLVSFLVGMASTASANAYGGWDIVGAGWSAKEKIGVLLYTHGIMNDPLRFKPTNDMLTAIERDVTKSGKIVAEKILHMPYTWDSGLMSLDKLGTSHAVLLYADMFGPKSTVIHDVTKIFAGISDISECPGKIIDASNATGHLQHVVEQYGPVCSYMGQITIPARRFSNSVLVLAEPARPDHPALRTVFMKQATAVSQGPGNEILVLVGHGARLDANNEAQKKELSCAANYVKTKLGFAGAIGVTVREDWPDLSKVAVAEATLQVKELLEQTGASRVVFVPATGGGWRALEDALRQESLDVLEAPLPLPLGEGEFRKWAWQTLKETVHFVTEEKPTQSTVTPYWDRTYSCE
jgi:hypothetical protein